MSGARKMGCCCGCSADGVPDDGSHLDTPEAKKAIDAMFHEDPDRPGLIRWGRGNVGGVAVGYCPKCRHAFGVD
jgi:hypothetical protein